MVRMGAHVAVDHERRQLLVDHGVHDVLQHAQDVEALQDGVRELDVLGQWQ